MATMKPTCTGKTVTGKTFFNQTCKSIREYFNVVGGLSVRVSRGHIVNKARSELVLTKG